MAIQQKQLAWHLVVTLLVLFLGGDVASAWLPSSRATMSSRSSAAVPRPSLLLVRAGPAVLEPPTKEVEKVEQKQDKKENAAAASNYKKGGWAVRLFNDPFNKREFVSMVLCKICGLTDGQSYQVMMQAHKNGVSVVGRYDLERAELYKTALVENGLVSDMIPVDED